MKSRVVEGVTLESVAVSQKPRSCRNGSKWCWGFGDPLFVPAEGGKEAGSLSCAELLEL